jgi:hypothetical protein
MTSIYEDRTQLVVDVAIKAPCRAATTANITLNGEQTIDGVACVAGDSRARRDEAPEDPAVVAQTTRAMVFALLLLRRQRDREETTLAPRLRLSARARIR